MITKSHRTSWIAHGIAAVALVFGASNGANGQILIDDFREGNDDRWTRVDLLGDGIFDASSLSYNLASTGEVQEGLLISVWNGSFDPQFSNGFLQATMRADTQYSEMSLFLRGDLASFTNYVVSAAPAYSTSQFALSKLLGPNSIEVIGRTEPPPINAGEDWIAEFGAVGDELSLKVWHPGDPKPDDPQVTVIDTTFTSGVFGVAAQPWGNEDPELLSTTFDDIYFTVVPEPTAISVDIKPGSDRNPINLKSRGVLPVAVISTEDFFAPEISVDELLFGDPNLMNAGGTAVAPLRTSVEDVSGDGIMDLTMKFSIPEMIGSGVLGPDSTEARLAGYVDGVPQFIGRDNFDIVPKSRAAGIPEPSTWVLAIIGVLALLVRRGKQ